MNPRSWLAAVRRRHRIVRCLRAPTRTIILRYHSVAPPEQARAYVDPGLSLPPERFAEQLALLRTRFDVIDPDQLLHRLSGGRPSRPAVVLTFDDGYRDNHDHALPALRRAGVTATFFVVSGPLASGRGLWISELWRLVPRLRAGRFALPDGSRWRVPYEPARRRRLRRRLTRALSAMPEPDRERALDALAEQAGLPRGEGLEASFLSPEQLRALRAAGMTIGAHTRSHPHLDRIAAAHLDKEIAGSREDLERILGEPVVHFAYPNPGGGGRNAGAPRRAVAAAGFRSAMTSRAAPIGADADPLQLPRLGVYAGSSERSLFALLGERTGA